MASSTITLTVKDDGSATIDKISGKLAAMEQQAKQGAAGMSGAFATFQGTLGAIGVGIGFHQMLAFLTESVNKALGAQEAWNQLKFAVDAISGDSFGRYEAAVSAATERTATYGVVQKELVNTVLQLLVTNTGKLSESMDNLNLVFDLATQKHIDVASAARIVSLAMEGNVTALRKQIPEFAELLDELDKHANLAEKSALAVEFLHSKLDGATGAMSDSKRAVLEGSKAWADFKEGAGDKVLSWLGSMVQGFKDLDAHIKEATKGNKAYESDEDRLAEVMRQGNEAVKNKNDGLARAALATDEAAKATGKLAKSEDDRIKKQKESMDLIIREVDFNKHATDAINARTEAEKRLAAALGILAQAEAAGKKAALTAGGPDDAMQRIRQKAFSGASMSSAEIQQLQSTVSGLKDTGPVSFDDGLNADQRKIQASIRAGTAGVPGAAPGGGGGESTSTFLSDQQRLQRDLQALLLRTARSEATDARDSSPASVSVFIGGSQLTGLVDNEITSTQARREQQRGIE